MGQDAVIVALEEQVDCYKKLVKLAERQHEFVQQGNTEELLGVLEQRQAVLDQIGPLEKIVAPAKRQWGQFLTLLDGEVRGQAEGLLEETRRLLEEITTADRNDALVLQQRKLNISRQMGQQDSAAKVSKSYAAGAYGQYGQGMDKRL